MFTQGNRYGYDQVSTQLGIAISTEVWNMSDM